MSPLVAECHDVMVPALCPTTEELHSVQVEFAPVPRITGKKPGMWQPYVPPRTTQQRQFSPRKCCTGQEETSSRSVSVLWLKAGINNISTQDPNSDHFTV